MKMHARAASYFLSIVVIAVLFCGIEFVIEKYFCPNDELVDIFSAIVSALSFAECKKFFDRATDRIFFHAPRDIHADMIANVSHELQTPIAILRGNVERLQRRSISEEERACAERVVFATLDGMSRLIGSVLERAKGKMSRTLLEEAEISVPLLLQEVYEDFILLAEDKGIRLIVGPPDALPLGALGEDCMVCGDRFKLKEVLLNLLSNALKHTPCGGTVALEVARVGSAARVIVQDSGCGIAPDALPHIFERFYRIENHSVALMDGAAPILPSVPSNGIGLNICREIMAAHRGKISVETEQGKGSKFILSLPLSSSRRPAIINS